MPSEPSAKSSVLRAFRDAAQARWGADGLASIAARLSPGCRAATVEAIAIVTQWMPEAWVIEWAHAVYEGPAGRSLPLVREFAALAIDRGFGRIQRFMLSLATPGLLVAQAARLWRSEHDRGELHGALAGPRAATVTLIDHPYVADDLASELLAASLCRVLALARGGETATVRWRRDRDLLVFDFTW